MKWVVRGLLVLAILVSINGLFVPAHQDEMVFMRVGYAMQNFEQEGRLPYRDFSDFKPPGIYLIYWLNCYIVKLLMNWIPAFAGMTTGASMATGEQVIWVVRILVIMVNLVSAGMIYSIYIKYQKLNIKNTYKILNINRKNDDNSGCDSKIGRKGFVCGLSYLVLLQFYQGNFGLTEPFMVVGLLIAVWLLTNIKYQRSKIKNTNQKYKNWLLILLAGGCMGMALLFKQSALLSLLATGFWLIAFMDGRESWGSRVGRSLIFLLGVVVVWLPMLTWLVSQGILLDFWRMVVIYPLVAYPPMWEETMRQLPVLLWPIGVWVGFVMILKIKNQISLLCLSFGGQAKIQIKNLKSEIARPKIRDFVFNRIVSYRSFRSDRNAQLRLLWLMFVIPLPLVLTRPYHHYWLQILPFITLITIKQI